VRLRVSLMLRFKMTFNGFLWYFLRFSRIRSKTIMVSFNEYPMMVSSAAMIARVNSLSRIEKIPTVIVTSWIRATMAPMAYLSSRNQNKTSVTISAAAIRNGMLTPNSVKIYTAPISAVATIALRIHFNSKRPDM